MGEASSMTHSLDKSASFKQCQDFEQICNMMPQCCLFHSLWIWGSRKKVMKSILNIIFLIFVHSWKLRLN